MAKIKMVTIKLSPNNARLLSRNIDGWIDAGNCKGGLNPDEMKALQITFRQIMKQLYEAKASTVPSTGLGTGDQRS